MRVGIVVSAMARMEVSEAFGHQCLNAHAHEFIARVTEQFSSTDICDADETAGVNGQDSVGRKLEEILEFQARGCGVALIRRYGCIRSLGKEKESAKSFLIGTLDPPRRYLQLAEIPARMQMGRTSAHE
jgi:hypothetical protein